MDNSKVTDIMGNPNAPDLIGQKIWIEVVGDQVFVDWPRDGSFINLGQVDGLVMMAHQAIVNSIVQNTQLNQRPFPSKPPWAPKR